MIRPDLIVTWPYNSDYPAWRQMIRDYRTHFNNVIVVWMNPNRGEDYRDFIKKAMFDDFVLFVDSPPIKPGEDWRNVAVNAGIRQSLHAPWIWFTEQDFFFNETFWNFVDEHEDKTDYFYTDISGRMHPCNILIKRELLNQTSRDFGANPEAGYDHFGKLQRDLSNTKSVGLTVPEYLLGDKFIMWEHLNGLTHNFNLLSDSGEPNYEVERFKKYLRDCLNVSVPLDPKWVEVAKSAL